GADGGVLFGEKETASDRVLIVQLITTIEFQSVREDLAIHTGGDAIENEISHFIWPEQDRTVAREHGSLHAEVIDLLLIDRDCVCVLLGLILIQLRRIEIRPTHIGKYRYLARVIRN